MYAVVGGHGFIGSNLQKVLPDDTCIIGEGDGFDAFDFSDCDAVIHLAANASVRNGWDDPFRDIKDGVILTSMVLEEMRRCSIRRLVFSSTGSVYAPANSPRHIHSPRRATSLYAASKIACEELINAYTEAGHIDATILRLVSVLGPGLRRGLVWDFVGKLQANPEKLGVLAPGTSRKSYVHVEDVCTAIITSLWENLVGTFNVSTPDLLTPLEIAGIVSRTLGLTPLVALEGSTWVGDNPFIALHGSFIPEYTATQAVEDAARYAWEYRSIHG